MRQLGLDYLERLNKLSTHSSHITNTTPTNFLNIGLITDTVTIAELKNCWPEFEAELTSQGRYLPAYVTKEFDEYLT